MKTQGMHAARLASLVLLPVLTGLVGCSDGSGWYELDGGMLNLEHVSVVSTEFSVVLDGDRGREFILEHEYLRGAFVQPYPASTLGPGAWVIAYSGKLTASAAADLRRAMTALDAGAESGKLTLGSALGTAKIKLDDFTVDLGGLESNGVEFEDAASITRLFDRWHSRYEDLQARLD